MNNYEIEITFAMNDGRDCMLDRVTIAYEIHYF